MNVYEVLSLQVRRSEKVPMNACCDKSCFLLTNNDERLN